MRKLLVILSLIICSAAKGQDVDNIAASIPALGLDTSSIIQYYSDKGLALDSSANIALYCEVYKWLGTPYRYGGESDKGLDCSGFSNKIYTSVYNKELQGGSRDIYKTIKPINGRHLEEGDLVFFKIKKGQISHVGVYLRDGKFAHASYSSGVIISDLSENYYKKRFYKAGRFQ